MKKVLLPALTLVALVSLLSLSSGVLLAQDMTGTWQGVLEQPNRQFRTVIKVTKEDAGTLRAVLYSIDQNGQGAPGSMTLQSTTVRMSIGGAAYEGRLSDDGNTITGSVTQGANKMPLNLTRATTTTAWEIPATPAPLRPMAADISPGVEVSTIKPSPPQPGKLFSFRGRQFYTINTTLSDLITFAYGIHARQLTGAPSWVESDKYDITVVADAEGMPNERQVKAMLEKLLADRFKLSFHRDKKELSVYALTVARTGPKLTRTEVTDPNQPPTLIFRGLGVLPARNATMTNFANVMQSAVLDKPVVDQTGLTGKYDFTLTWTPDEFQFAGLGVRPPPPPDTATAPNLFTAVQEQLGLRLESTKAPAEVFVVDRVEKPTQD